MGKYLRLFVLVGILVGIAGYGVGDDDLITVNGNGLDANPIQAWALTPGGVPSGDDTVTAMTLDSATSNGEIEVLNGHTHLSTITIVDNGASALLDSDDGDSRTSGIVVNGGTTSGLSISITANANNAGITSDPADGNCIWLQGNAPDTTITLQSNGAGIVTIDDSGGPNIAIDGNTTSNNMTVIMNATSTGNVIVNGALGFGSGTNQLQLLSSNNGGTVQVAFNVQVFANTLEVIINETAAANTATTAGVLLGGGTLNVVNTIGTWDYSANGIVGDQNGAANDTVTVDNTAATGAVTFIGDIDLADGNNTITINGGAANTLTMRAANIQTGSGNDTVTISGQTILTDGGVATCIVNTGSGNDTITFNLDQNVATLNDATIRPGAGTNTVNFNISDNNDKLLHTLDLQDDGNNTINFTNADAALRTFTINTLTPGNGNDTFNIDALNAVYTEALNVTFGAGVALDLGGGTNSIRIIADDNAATLTTTAAGITASNDSRNTITISSTDSASAELVSTAVGANVNLGAGTGSNSILVNASGSNNGSARFNLTGNDFTATGSGAQSIYIWTSDSTTGTARFDVDETTLGSGNDTVSVTVSSSGAGSDASYNGTDDLNLGAGDDTVTVDSSSGGGAASLTAVNLLFDTGNDTINLTGGTAAATAATITGVIDMGDGDDTITATRWSIFGGGGNINLGAGNDTMTVNSTAAGVSGRTIIANAGDDTISITNSGDNGAWTGAGSVTVDLDTGAGAGDADTLTVNGGSAADGITIAVLNTDTANTGDTTITTTGNVNFAALHTNGGLSNILDLGDGTNTFDFTSTAGAALPNACTIQGGAGTDTISLTNDNNAGAPWTPGIINGDAGDDTISLTVANTGDLTVTTVNTNTGNNTLNLNDSGGGDLTVAIFNCSTGNDTLNLNNTSAGTLTVGTINPAGNLMLNSNGNATITNALDLTAAGTTDTVNVQSGTLTFGVGAANLTLGAGDTIQGMGTLDVGTLTISGAGSTTNPGSSSTIGTLTVAGNYAHTGTDFNINYNASGNDMLTVTGTATITGGTVTPELLGAATLVQDNTSYTFLQAGTLTVTTPLTMNAPSSPFLSFDLSFTATDYMWTVHRSNYTNVYTDLNSNQTAIANNLQRILITAPTGDMETVLLEIDKLDTLEKFKDAMNDISPEPYTAVVNTVDHSLLTVFTGEVSNHLASMRAGGTSFAFVENDPERKQPKGPSGPSAQTEADAQAETPAEKKHLRTWAKAYGSWSDVSKVPDRFGYDVDTSGGIVGGDSRFGLFTLGLCLGYDETHIDWKPDSAVGDVDALHVGTYGSFSIGHFYADASVIYSSNSHNVTRNITFAGINRSANADYDSDSYSFYLGAGYDLQFKNWTLSPMASIQYTNVDMDDMIEDGASSLNLLVKGDNVNSFKTSLGFKLGYLFKVAHAIVHPTINAAWIREYGDNNQSLTASFEGAPGYTFQVDPRYIGDDTYKFGLGVEVHLDNNVSLNFNYNYELTDCKEYDDIDSHLINGGISILF